MRPNEVSIYESPIDHTISAETDLKLIDQPFLEDPRQSEMRSGVTHFILRENGVLHDTLARRRVKNS